MRLTVGFISQSDVSQEISRINMSPQLQLFYSKAQKPRLVKIEPWEVPFVDISLLRTWIRACEDIHGNSCAGGIDGFCDVCTLSSYQITEQLSRLYISICMADRILAELPRGFRLIDVNTMAIASPVNQIRFVALSYMWQQGGDNHAQLAKQNLKELEAPNGLTGISIPSIVLDAISLCKELGERYLWVDRFCIVQNDPQSKHDQIRGMDKIYRSATFTIVAALNNRDGRGLPGCLNRPRRSSIWTSDREFDIESRGLRPRSMQAIVNDSLWNRRG